MWEQLRDALNATGRLVTTLSVAFLSQHSMLERILLGCFATPPVYTPRHQGPLETARCCCYADTYADTCARCSHGPSRCFQADLVVYIPAQRWSYAGVSRGDQCALARLTPLLPATRVGRKDCARPGKWNRSNTSPRPCRECTLQEPCFDVH